MPTIRQLLETLHEPDGLTRTLGEITVCRNATGDPLHWVGNSAVVFRIRRDEHDFALKCYLRKVPHLAEIYGRHYLPEELYVWNEEGSGTWCDVTLTEWIEGRSLREAAEEAVRSGDQATLRRLAEAFDRLALELLDDDCAHGDLKPENLIVDNTGTIHPIDFDACFRPSFAGERSPELGTAAYQHPYRTAADYDASLDDYPIALISVSLHALALQPELLAHREEEEGLLLSPVRILRGRSPLYDEVIELFECACDALHYRMARLLTLPLLRLEDLPELMHYAVHRPVCSDGTESYTAHGLWGFRTADSLLTPPLYHECFDYSEGLAAVRLGRWWHFIDNVGRRHFDCRAFSAVKPFANGSAIACRGPIRYRIDRETGRCTRVTPPHKNASCPAKSASQKG